MNFPDGQFRRNGVFPSTAAGMGLDKPHPIAFNLNWAGSVQHTVLPHGSTFNACLPAFVAPVAG